MIPIECIVPPHITTKLAEEALRRWPRHEEGEREAFRASQRAAFCLGGEFAVQTFFPVTTE